MAEAEAKSAAGVVTDHGLCSSCGEVVDVVVDIHQKSGSNKFMCVTCRCDRIMKKAQETIGGIKEQAEEARSEAAQLGLALKE